MSLPASRTQWVAIALLATLIFSVLLVRYYRKDLPLLDFPLVPETIAVMGDVKRPGNYLLEGTQVTAARAIEAAGGLRDSLPGEVLTESAAREIRGGQQVHVLWSETGVRELRIEPMPAAARITLGEKLNVNTASEEELMLVPLMKAGFSAAIVNRRSEGNWQSVDALEEIPGVGPKTVERWKNYLEVSWEGRGGEHERQW
jgi:competence protein ComEA